MKISIALFLVFLWLGFVMSTNARANPCQQCNETMSLLTDPIAIMDMANICKSICIKEKISSSMAMINRNRNRVGLPTLSGNLDKDGMVLYLECFNNGIEASCQLYDQMIEAEALRELQNDIYGAGGGSHTSDEQHQRNLEQIRRQGESIRNRLRSGGFVEW